MASIHEDLKGFERGPGFGPTYTGEHDPFAWRSMTLGPSETVGITPTPGALEPAEHTVPGKATIYGAEAAKLKLGIGDEEGGYAKVTVLDVRGLPYSDGDYVEGGVNLRTIGNWFRPSASGNTQGPPIRITGDFVLMITVPGQDDQVTLRGLRSGETYTFGREQQAANNMGDGNRGPVLPDTVSRTHCTFSMDEERKGAVFVHNENPSNKTDLAVPPQTDVVRFHGEGGF